MSDAPFNRRDLARRAILGAIGAIPAIAATAAIAAEEEETVPIKSVSSAELVLQLVQRQYPQQLGAEHLAQIHKDIESALSRSRLLSGFPLVNADEPAFVFAAYRKQGD